MGSKLLIIGAGQHGNVVKEIAEDSKIYQVIDFIDDNNKKAIGTPNEISKFIGEYTHCFIALGDNTLREKYLKMAKEIGYKIPIIIHKSSVISRSAQIGEGTIILQNSVVSTNSKVEEGCIIGIGALIDHDSTIKEYSYLKPGTIVAPSKRINKGTITDIGQIIKEDL